jgi:hypothetical protein
MPDGTLQERLDRLIGVLSALAAEEQALVAQLRRARLAQSGIDMAARDSNGAFRGAFSAGFAPSFAEYPPLESSAQEAQRTPAQAGPISGTASELRETPYPSTRGGPEFNAFSGPSPATQSDWPTASRIPPAIAEAPLAPPHWNDDGAGTPGKRDYDYFAELDEKLARLQFQGSDGSAKNR